MVRDDGPGTLPPFLGVPISIKDVIDAAGLPTTHSSKVLADHMATADDPLVERLRHAGFVVLGKSNVPEFCTSMTSSELNGICRNPWDTDRTPGGSSGGAAAGLAAALCAVAHGTDGAGSVRVPASFCGLVGVKPTRGLVGFGPERGNAYYQTSVDGILSHSVRDAAGLLDVYVGMHDARHRRGRADRRSRGRTCTTRIPVACASPSRRPSSSARSPTCAPTAARRSGAVSSRSAMTSWTPRRRGR